MGTRAVVALAAGSRSCKNFYALGLDYAWGHNSIDVFENEVKRRKKNFVGAVFSPIGTKDYSTYITKIRQSGADACFIVMQGDDNNAFLSQSRAYQLPDKVQLLTEIVDLAAIRAVGDASLGLVGSSRYSFTIDNPANKDFVALWQEGARRRARHVRGRAVAGLPGARRRHREGRQHRGRQAAPGARDRRRSTASRARSRCAKCDHQAVQQGFMVKVVKKEGFDHPIPEVIATYPAERTTPPCNKMTYDD